MMDDYIGVEAFAEMHNMALNAVYLLLRKDVTLPVEERRLPGAIKVGGRFRGEWRIPRADAEAFERDRRGRPRADKAKG